MAQNQKHYLVKWEIDITASSPEDAARQALEIQRDKDSEAVTFEAVTDNGRSNYQINLFDENEGSDICYDCGKAGEYQTMQDVDIEDFTIYCDDCLPKAQLVQELKKVHEMLVKNLP